MADHIIFGRKGGFIWALPLLLMVGAGFGCERQGQVVLAVGDRQLTAEVLAQDLALAAEELPIPENHRENIKKELIDHIVDRYLILEYARRAGIGVSKKEFEAYRNDIKMGYTEALFEQVLLRKSMDPETWENLLEEQLVIEKAIRFVTKDVAPPDYEEIKACFESNPESFKAPERVKFRQIFCRTRKEANALYARIRAGEDLAALAGSRFEGPEAEKGWEVGWVARGTLDKSLDKVLFKMAPGDISPVVKSASGYHILEVMDRQPEGFQPFSKIIAEIEEELLERKRRVFCKKWLQNLRSHIKVRINQKAIDKLEFS